jgi:hypothetical protein
MTFCGRKQVYIKRPAPGMKRSNGQWVGLNKFTLRG